MTSAGTLVTVEGRPALRFERRYPHPIERVWRAVTEPDELSRWFPANVVGDRSVGAALVFDDDAQRAADREAGQPTREDGPPIRGRVVTFDPPNVFSFTWGGELLRFELSADGGDTVLLFTHLLSHQSVAARNGAGWHACLAELGRLLGHQPADGEAEGDWMAVYRDYLRRVGPALGVAGGDGSLTWERSTHVDADRVRAVVTDPEEVACWGGGERVGDPVRWEVEPADHGTTYRLVHPAVGRDPQLAATWHALLIQLDLYLAAGVLVPVEADLWVDAYAQAL